MNRRLFLKSTAASVILLTTGCATTTSLFKPISYEERISSILTTPDNNTLIIITDKFHYIFNDQDKLLSLINSSMHKKVKAYIENVHVDGNNIVVGSLDLTIDGQLTDEERKESERLGFIKTKYFERLEIKLTGKRYDANGIQPNIKAQKLNKEYTISVTAEQSTTEKALKAPLTPITVAYDGALVIGAIPLFIAGVALMLVVYTPCFFGEHCS